MVSTVHHFVSNPCMLPEVGLESWNQLGSIWLPDIVHTLYETLLHLMYEVKPLEHDHYKQPLVL